MVFCEISILRCVLSLFSQFLKLSNSASSLLLPLVKVEADDIVTEEETVTGQEKHEGAAVAK